MEQSPPGKIYCANCLYCCLLRNTASESEEHHVLRIRCSRGHWRKKLGEEKIYKYFTILRRSMDSCPDYEPMGDPKPFLKELRRELPLKDEEYPD